MSNVLYLTKAESDLFGALPPSLRAKWSLEKQEIHTTESPDELYLRYQIARFDHPACKALATAVRDAKDQKAFEKAFASFDASTLSRQQLAELFFVLGISVTGSIVTFLLSSAATPEDIEGIASITHIRKMLVEVNLSPSAL